MSFAVGSRLIQYLCKLFYLLFNIILVMCQLFNLTEKRLAQGGPIKVTTVNSTLAYTFSHQVSRNVNCFH